MKLNGHRAARALTLKAPQNGADRSRALLFLLANRRALTSFDLRILQGVESFCDSCGWEVRFSSCHYAASDAAPTLCLPEDWADSSPERAAVLCGTNHANLLGAFKERQIPFAVLGNGVTGNWTAIGSDAVFSDDIRGAHDITMHLIASGHQDILFVGDERSPDHVRRLAGYRVAARMAQCRPLVSEVRSCGKELGYLAIRSMLSNGRRATAVVAANELIAEGVVEALQQAGARELAVAGFGDRKERLRTPAAVVEFPEQLGERLAELALHRAGDGTSPARQFTVPTELVVAGEQWSASQKTMYEN